MTKKIKLNKSHREVIQEFGLKHIASTIDRSKEQKQLAILLEGTNAAIRKKYSEADMAVLRKYKLAQVDLCIKLQFPSGRVDGFTFPADTGLADIPYCRSCYYGNSEVFPVSERTEAAFDACNRMRSENDAEQKQKEAEFRAFLAACQFVDEVLDVINLPEDLRKRLGQSSTALVAVTPETVKSLKATFKKAA